MARSFSLANMVPQDQTHNGGAWARSAGHPQVRDARVRRRVYVFTGPVYADKPRTIGSGVARAGLYLQGRVRRHHQALVGALAGQQRQHQAGPPISYEEFVKRTGLRLLPEAG